MKHVVLLLIWLALVPSAEAGERILSLTPHACEMLFAIGAGKDVVGVSEYCDYPPEAENLPKVGNARQVYLEAAIKLKPTLAVVGSRSLKGVGQLLKLGIQIVETHPHTVKEILADMRMLGKRTGHQERADLVAEQLRLRLQALRRRSAKPARIFYEIWPDPLMSEGGASFITDMVQYAGGKNIFAETPLESMRVDVESVIRAKPEVIIIPDEGRDVVKRRAFWHRWLGERIHVITVDADLFHRPGPRLIDGIEQLRSQMAVQP